MIQNEHCKDAPVGLLYEVSGSFLDMLEIASAILPFYLGLLFYKKPSMFLFMLILMIVMAFIGRRMIHGHITSGLHVDCADFQIVSQVVSSGPYKLVRHPWYFVASVFAFTITLFLVNQFGLLGITFSIFFGIFIYRIRAEEQFLSSNFPEHSNYCKEVKYKI